MSSVTRGACGRARTTAVCDARRLVRRGARSAGSTRAPSLATASASMGAGVLVPVVVVAVLDAGDFTCEARHCTYRCQKNGLNHGTPSRFLRKSTTHLRPRRRTKVAVPSESFRECVPAQGRFVQTVLKKTRRAPDGGPAPENSG